jgi:chemotaxis protein MotA
MDIVAFIGTFIGIACILLGQALEGGSIAQLIQVTAAFIVFGGTLGAVVLSFPANVLLNAVKNIRQVYFSGNINYKAIIDKIITFAQKARKDGVISLEQDAKLETDPFMKLGLEVVSDGTDPKLVREMLENQISQIEARDTVAAKVWESAGGFSPTIGIIGAVLGLIQVMQNLSDPSKLGAGIAVAFVATVYGVGFANLIAIPLSSNLKCKLKERVIAQEIILEGILAIQAGESPALIERKLQTYVL